MSGALREFALDEIRPYVLRGDSITSYLEGWPGGGGPGRNGAPSYHYTVRGYFFRYGSDTSVRLKPYEMGVEIGTESAIFDVRELWAEVLGGVTQLALI